MLIEDLETSLQGCTHVNLRQLARENFTPELLDTVEAGLWNSARHVQNLGFHIGYHPSELEKCVTHYCARELIDDLWKFSAADLRDLMDEDGRFKLDQALKGGEYGEMTGDLTHNLDLGYQVIYGLTTHSYMEWVDDMRRRYEADPKDKMVQKFTIYRLHSMLINGGDWAAPSIIESTISRGARETFDWTADYPDLTREEIEKIAESLLDVSVAQASQLGITSMAEEQVHREARARGELIYILDAASGKLILNPKLKGDIAREEEDRRKGHADQTQLLLNCPAKYVPGQLFEGGSMLHDFIRFRSKVYVEAYLAAQEERC